MNEPKQSGSDHWQERYAASILPTYGRPQRVLVRGEGAYLWDADGQRYLDLLGGIATSALGHAHPGLTKAVTEQLATLGHISNFFIHPAQVELAERLLALAGAPAGSRVFFANSGAEANEVAFKLARRTGRPRILALEGGFHGRTMGALALTHNPRYREPFAPLPAGVQHLPFHDLPALQAAIGPDIAAVVLEPIQGEGGVRPLSAEYLRAARELCTEHGALLVLDEVQTGIGRTGDWFAHTRHGIAPDVLTLAKGLGGGVPIGAALTFGDNASALLGPGQHGTTYGGNPLATAAALAVIDAITAENLLDHVRDIGQQLSVGLLGLGDPDGLRITGVRGSGLLLGLELSHPHAAEVAAAALAAGFLVNAVAPDVIRLAPPLILSAEQAADFVAAVPVLLADCTVKVGK